MLDTRILYIIWIFYSSPPPTCHEILLCEFMLIPYLYSCLYQRISLYSSMLNWRQDFFIIYLFIDCHRYIYDPWLHKHVPTFVLNKVPLFNRNELEYNIEKIIDVNDSLLDRVNINIDTESGVNKPDKLANTVRSVSSWNNAPIIAKIKVSFIITLQNQYHRDLFLLFCVVINVCIH